MTWFRLTHQHGADDCPTAFAAWKGFDSPLRGQEATSSCRCGDHHIWWDVEAVDEDEAVGYLPSYVAARVHVARIGEVTIP